MVYVYDIDLKQIEAVELDWKHKDRISRIRKSFNNSNEFFACFTDKMENNGKCVAVCAFEPGQVNYLDEFCADGIPGIGFTTLRKAIEFRYRKCWLLASPDYDEETDTYKEAEGLNEKYRNQEYLKEIRLSPSENCWNCPVSLFSTENVSDGEVRNLFRKRFGN